MKYEYRSITIHGDMRRKKPFTVKVQPRVGGPPVKDKVFDNLNQAVSYGYFCLCCNQEESISMDHLRRKAFDKFRT